MRCVPAICSLNNSDKIRFRSSVTFTAWFTVLVACMTSHHLAYPLDGENVGIGQLAAKYLCRGNGSDLTMSLKTVRRGAYSWRDDLDAPVHLITRPEHAPPLMPDNVQLQRGDDSCCSISFAFASA